MTFKTYLSVFGSDDKKHDLERKFGYKFRALESVYPNADKLPDDEIQKAIDVFYEGSPNESTDVMLNRVKDYTTKNEPMWNEKYFNPKPKPMQTSVSQAQINNLQPQMPNLMQKPKLKGFGDYDKNLINKFYNHAKQPNIEGYVDYPYCDSKGLITGGVGLRMPNAKAMQKFTLTSQKAPVSSNNPAWNNDKINTFYDKMDNFCKSYKIGVDEKGNDVWDVKSAKQQKDVYKNMYQEELPYFQDAELEDKSKTYVKNSVLPVIRRNISNIGLDFDTDFNEDGQLALMDMQYNLGENKCKFIDLEDTNSVINSDLSQDIKKKLIYNPAMYYEDKNVQKEVLKGGYWPNFTRALKNRDAASLAKQSHRKDVQKKRNEWAYDSFLNGFNK